VLSYPFQAWSVYFGVCQNITDSGWKNNWLSGEAEKEQVPPDQARPPELHFCAADHNEPGTMHPLRHAFVLQGKRMASGGT